MSTMTFVIPNRQEPDALSVFQVFGTKTHTFWESLSTQSRGDSVNTNIYRNFYKQTAWDIAGPVLDHWNQVLVHAIHATFKSHHNDILRGRGWDGAIDCWMIGDSTECALPKVVVSCIDLSTVKRFMRKIIKDGCWQASGFDLVGRRGCLKYAAGVIQESLSHSTSTVSTGFEAFSIGRGASPNSEGDKRSFPGNPIIPDFTGNPTAQRLDRFSAESVDFSGLEVIIQPNAGPYIDEMKTTTVGGLILLEEAFYCLCNAHAFIASRAASSTTTTNAALEIDDDDEPEGDLISWHDIEEDYNFLNDESSDESDQSTESLQMSEGSAPNTFRNDHDLFEAAGAFLRPSNGDRPTKLQLGRPIASFVNGTGTSKPNVGLEKDWALLTPNIEPKHMINQVQFQGRPLDITRLGKLSNTKPLLVRSKYGDPLQVECSRAVSLIPSLVQGILNSAHIVNERIDAGESGSWIIDADSGDLIGIVVAASPRSRHGYMIPAIDVFAGIIGSRTTDSHEVQIALPSTELLTAKDVYQALLYRAAQSGSEAIVSMLLKQSLGKMNRHGEARMRTLRVAKDGGHEEVVKLLVAADTQQTVLEAHPLPAVWKTGYTTTDFQFSNPLGATKILKRKRASKPKVRTGCKTCKIRRIKCDETKPSCKRCTSTGRKCDGYDFTEDFSRHPVSSILSSPRYGVANLKFSLPASISNLFEGNIQERRIFHRFQYCTIPALAGGFQSNFWTKTVLQMGHEESIIRSAIIALGTLHEDYQDRQGKHTPNLIDDQSYRHALKLYGNALQDLNGRLNVPSRINAKLAIVASILFSCFEVLRRNNMAMVIHYQQGMRELLRQRNLLQEEKSLSSYSEDAQSDIDELLRVFARYDIQGKTVTSERKLEHLVTEVNNPPTDPTQIPLHLDELLIAAHQLTSDLRGYRYWKKELVPLEWRLQHEKAVKTFDTWMDLLEKFLQSRALEFDSSPGGFMWLLGRTLQIKAAIMALKLGIDCGAETSFDMFREEFEDMVVKVEQTNSRFHFREAKPLDIELKPFTMEFEIVHPLFFVATKCRDWDIRRRAVNQLRSAGKEGVLEGPIMAILAMRLIDLEEEGLLKGSVIPEANRIHEIDFTVDYNARQILFQVTRMLDTTWKYSTVHREAISF